MNWTAFLRAEAFPEYAAAVAMLALAFWLVRLPGRDAAALSFAAFLVARATNMVVFTFETLSTSAADALVWERIRPVPVILTVFALAAFLLAFPKPRTHFRQTTQWAVAASAAVATLAYLVYPGAWATYTVIGDALTLEEIGPLYAFQYLRIVGIGVASFVFALEWHRRGAEQGQLLLVSLAFGLHALFDASDAARLLLLNPPSAFHEAILAQVIMEVATSLPVIFGAILVAFHAGHERNGPASRRFLLLLPLPVATNALLFLLVWVGLTADQGPPSLFLLGLWRLSLPLLVTYALVRHQLFGLDVRVKRNLQRFITAAVFVAVFFSLSEGAEAIVSEEAGAYAGVLAAVVLALALTPLQRAVERVADAAMPQVEAVHELHRHERRALYRALTQSAWASGRIGRDERKMLDAAARHLVLGRNEQTSLERDAKPVPKKALKGHPRT